MKKIDLGDGEFAVLREMADLKRSHLRQMFRMFDEYGIKAGEGVGYDGGAVFVDAALAILIDSWSFDAPVSVESVGDLPLTSYRLLDEASDETTKQMLNLTQEPDPKSGPSSSTPAKTASSSRGRKSI